MSNDRLKTYLYSIDGGIDDNLLAIEEESIKNFVPVIRKDMQAFLRFLMQTKKPLKILEVGAATGFSACLMATYAPKECVITTIENWEPRIPIAKENFLKCGFSDKITLLEGDASDILVSLLDEGKEYDFIFMDAAKGQYPAWLPTIEKLLRDGGMLVTDNVLFDGDIVESRFAVKRRNRTIHKRMREYLYTLMHHESFVSTILDVGDGACVSVKQSYQI